jgi:hypothetical protein
VTCAKKSTSINTEHRVFSPISVCVFEMSSVSQAKNYFNARLQLERNVFARAQLTPAGNRIVFEDLERAQVEQVGGGGGGGGGDCGKIELNTMELNSLLKQWPEIVSTCSSLELTPLVQAATVIREPSNKLEYVLLPDDVELREPEKRTVWKLQTNSRVTVHITPQFHPKVTFIRERIHESEDPTQPARLELITSDAINKLTALLRTVQESNCLMFSESMAHQGGMRNGCFL